MRILIVDDHPLFRAALIAAIKNIIYEVQFAETASVAELYQCLERYALPDVVLLDLNLPGASGFSALVHIRAHYPELPVIVVSAHEEVDLMHRAIAHGAMGYIPKSASAEEIGEAITAIAEGEEWLPKHAKTAYKDPRAPQETSVANQLQELTPQQFRVLMMIAEGLLNKQIAYHLNVSEATIKAHVTAIFRKLGVQSRTQAVLAISALQFDKSAAVTIVEDSLST